MIEGSILEPEGESRIDECVECYVKERDFSKKKVYKCGLCGRWFCERHSEPRLAFIRNLQAVDSSPAIRALYHTEWQREDGHPDFEYSRIKLAEIELEERTRSKLIEEALDGMNAHYKTWRFRRVETPSHDLSHSDGVELIESRERRYPKYTRSLHVDWRKERFLTSLKFWFSAFWIAVVLLFLIEGSNSTLFYNNVPDAVKYVFYGFASAVALLTGYRVFEKLDTNTTSDRGLFGLRILSGLVLMAGVFMLIFGIFYQIGFFTNSLLRPTLSLARTTVSAFLIVLSLAFLLISSYLMFKFERRSGVIVYRR